MQYIHVYKRFPRTYKLTMYVKTEIIKFINLIYKQNIWKIYTHAYTYACTVCGSESLAMPIHDLGAKRHEHIHIHIHIRWWHARCVVELVMMRIKMANGL